MEEEKQEQKSHAKVPRRKEGSAFAPLRLCGSFVCGATFVLCFALVVRSGALLLTPRALQEDVDGYRRLAANLIEHGTFGRGDVPTAYRPPLYPLLLTGCVCRAGVSPAQAAGTAAPQYSGPVFRELLAIGILHVLLGVATVGLVLALARCWGLGSRGAAVAALLVACDPILLASSSLVMTETLATFLTTAGLLALTWAGRHRTTTAIAGSQRLPESNCPLSHIPGAVGSRLFLRQMAAGAMLALAALCRPVFLLWLLAVCAVWIARVSGLCVPLLRRGNTRRGPQPSTACKQAVAHGTVASLAAFALGALIVLSPWAIRNQVQFGRPIVTTTHGGYTLLLANNPEFYDWLRRGSWGSVWQADQFNADWERRRPSDELQADRQAYGEAWQTIRAQPGRFLYACAVRIGRFWSPLPHRLTAEKTPWPVRHLIEIELYARLGQLPHRVTAEEPPLRRLSRYTVALWYIAEFLLALLGLWRLVTYSPLPLGEGPRVRAAGQKSDGDTGNTTRTPQPQPALTLALSQRERGQTDSPALTSSAWLWGLLLAICLMAGHAVYWTDMRMRAPLMPVVAIIAASGLPFCSRPRDD